MSVFCKLHANDIWVVSPRGRLDQSLNLKLEQTLGELLDDDHHRFIINMSEVTYINSGGLRCLVSAWRRAREQTGDLILCELNSRIEEIFSLVGFDRVFQIYASFEDAKRHTFP